MIIIVNYGMGNLGSVQNMFKRICVPTEITDDVNKIEKAQKLLLPRLALFGTAMQRIEESGLKNILDKKVFEGKIAVLRICLGM
ncbi:MAG: hypothetical protein H0W75_00215 [Chitinophagaceae bacterium]|nr:hypothetical protein [Chitinophagaceae bacterium]